MFACSNIQVIEQLAYTIIEVFNLGLHPPDSALLVRNIRLSENVFGRINVSLPFLNPVPCGIHADLLRQYFMSDAIVVWRAWVLWQDSIRIKILLSLCIFVSLGNSLLPAVDRRSCGSQWV
jgi:hypothetical protein